MNVSWPTVVIAVAILATCVILIVTGHEVPSAIVATVGTALTAALPQAFKRNPDTVTATVTTTATAPAPKDGAS